MDKSKLQEYASLKELVSQYEARLDEIKPEILAYMAEQEADKIDTDFGSFNLEKRRVWKFSNKWDKAKEDLKEIEKVEKAEGTATYEETPILKFYEKNVKS